MASRHKYGRTAGALHRTSPALRAKFPHLRSWLPTLGSSSFLAASVGRVSGTTIRRYIAEQTTRLEKGLP